jgi:hypothetical protein
MKNKQLIKQSIQKSLKENILKEKFSDVIPGAISGVKNAFTGITGQYSLGQMDNKLQRVSGRIEKDWSDAKSAVADKANKLQQSSNQNIAQQGKAVLQKVDAIDKSLNQALQILKTPAAEVNKQEDQKESPEFNRWMIKQMGVDPNVMTKKENSELLVKYATMKALKLDPLNIPLHDMDREIAIAANKRQVDLQKLDKDLRKATGLGIPSDMINHEMGVIKQNQDKLKNNEPVHLDKVLTKLPKNEKSAQKLPADKENNIEVLATKFAKQWKNRHPEASNDQVRQKRQQMLNLMLKGKVPPGSIQSQLNATTAPAASLAVNKNVNQTNPVKQPPRAVSPPLAVSQNQEEQPIPLTKLKPVVPSALKMPPRQKNVVPALRDVLPIKDNGKEIQVGSEENPAMKPREDVLRSKQSSIYDLKRKAEKTKNPKDIELYKKALEKDVLKSNKK